MSAIGQVQTSPPENLAPPEKGMDLFILIPTLALVALGIVMVFSASIPVAAPGDEGVYHYLKRELVFASLGLLAMWVMSVIPMQTIKRMAGWLTVLSLLLLVIALKYGRWLPTPFMGLRFQPSELAKLALVLVTARYFARYPRGIGKWSQAWPPLVLLGAFAMLIVVAPDLGTAVSLSFAMLIYFHIAGMKGRHLSVAAVVGALLAVAMIMTHSYQRERLLGFISRSELASDEGYHATQLLIALGSGGVTGRGFCQGLWKFYYLPAAMTDSILAVIGEEMGLIATWGVLILFGTLIWRGFTIAQRASDRFAALVAVGITSVIGIQALVNISVALHMVPSTGIPLPLVSYGGSSLVITLAGMGILLNVSRSCEVREKVVNT